MKAPANAARKASASVSIDAWRTELRTLAGADSNHAWRLADCMAAGVQEFGPAAIAEASELLGRSVQALKNHARTAAVFPVERRRATLTFSHHLDVAALPEAEQDRLLDAAESGSWTLDELRAAIHEASGAAEVGSLKARVAELERLLAQAHLTPDEAKRSRVLVERAVSYECRTITGAYRHMAASIRGYCESPAFRSLHGNERRGAIRRIRADVVQVTRDAADLVDRELEPLLGSDS